ncbi:MAG: LptF/LptG family permease [Spirochaetales bacterium]|nr:LptF/LptG family permease [Spirochaetales bacterium]
MARSTSRLLSSYVLKEFLKSFFVAFLFFFAIFFVNTILLLVQKILLKNISVSTMVEMVLLYMPQFLVYTFPFATLTSSSMVLGDMASSNELLAMKSLGISSYRVYAPLVIASVVLSVMTFITADVLQPYTSVIYRDKLAVLMAEMPTMEIESNTINSVGNIMLSNGKAEGSVIEDLLLISKDEEKYNKSVYSSKGEMTIVDPVSFVYSLDLDKPSILLTSRDEINTYAYAMAEKGRIYLDFSSQVPSLTSSSPVNLSSKDLLSTIKERDNIQNNDRSYYYKEKENTYFKLSSLIEELGKKSVDDEYIVSTIDQINKEDGYLGDLPVNFYGQYYKSELTKKIALSIACTVLTLITLPLSNVRVRHGKLTGFAVAIVVAVSYWYMLFGAQLMIFNITSSPYLLILAPDIFITIIAFILLFIYRKAR